MTISESPLDTHLKAALREAEDDTARYHIREALQLRIVEETAPDGC
ncbi:hypothetical protein EGD98_04960 [Halomicroarcula sp. F24A]|uniref:Uncharacterized protein n=1 Tax=Haloarcula salinisoli TaxID=2487746 RepID=A0A8J7YBS8_9EURY|nr:hypothetical protein [Halomicroarcula salinisoli]